jgi:hypothetical protein
MKKLTDILTEVAPPNHGALSTAITADESKLPVWEVRFEKIERYVYTGIAKFYAEDKIEAKQKALNLDPAKDINWKVTTFKLIKPPQLVDVKQKDFEFKLKEDIQHEPNQCWGCGKYFEVDEPRKKVTVDLDPATTGGNPKVTTTDVDVCMDCYKKYHSNK